DQSRTFTAQRNAGFSEKEALRRSRGVSVDNLGGVTAGGPIRKDHTFFFTDYDRQWVRSTAVPAPTTAISPEGLANLQAAGSLFAPGALDFLTRTFPIANDPTPRGNQSVVTGPDPNCDPSRPPLRNCVLVPMRQYNRALTGSFPYGTDFW